MPDEYQTYCHTRSDAELVAIALKKNGTVVFPYSHDQIGCLIVLMSKDFYKLGMMPFGGNPTGRIYIALYHGGCSHFSAQESPFHTYFEEKLDMGQTDAIKFAEFYGWVLEYLNHEEAKI